MNRGVLPIISWTLFVYTPFGHSIDFIALLGSSFLKFSTFASIHGLPLIRRLLLAGVVVVNILIDSRIVLEPADLELAVTLDLHGLFLGHHFGQIGVVCDLTSHLRSG